MNWRASILDFDVGADADTDEIPMLIPIKHRAITWGTKTTIYLRSVTDQNTMQRTVCYAYHEIRHGMKLRGLCKLARARVLFCRVAWVWGVADGHLQHCYYILL